MFIDDWSSSAKEKFTLWASQCYYLVSSHILKCVDFCFVFFIEGSFNRGRGEDFKRLSITKAPKTLIALKLNEIEDVEKAWLKKYLHKKYCIVYIHTKG
jgi:hypothetical protein